MPNGNRDNQRSRLYNAEDVLRGRRPSRAAKRHLVDTQHVSGWRVRDESVPLPPESEWPTFTRDDGTVERLRPLGKTKPIKAPSVAATQEYVDAVLAAAWFQRRWGRRAIRVLAGRGSHANMSLLGGVSITVSQHHRRSEAVILHEIAHILIGGGYAPHGPEFAGVLLTLVRHQMGAEHAKDLRESFRKHRVRATTKAVPAPRRQVVPVAEQQAAAKREAARHGASHLSPRAQRTAAAAIIRGEVKAGLFGPAGSKPRTHALATARALEA